MKFVGMPHILSNYLIEIINYILYNQDFELPVAALACAVDFLKALDKTTKSL